MFDVDDLKVFVKVAELASLSKAAEVLRRPKSTASRQIARLEHLIGAPLLQRTPRSMRLSDEGRILLHHAVRIISALNDAEAAMAAAQNQPRGTLHVNVPHLFASQILAPRTSAFLARYPDIDLIVDIAQKPIGDIANDVDLAIRVGPVGDSALVGKKIGVSELRLFASPAMFAAETRADFERDLVASALIEGAQLTSFRQVIARRRGALAMVMQIWEPATRHAFVLAGAGAAWLPVFLCTSDVATGRLTPLLADRRFAPIDIWALFSMQAGASAKVRAFLDFLSEIDFTAAGGSD